MSKDGKQSYYEVLDVSFNSNPEVIRTAYIRAKNAYNRDSLAAYSLFDKDESKRILDEIEEAYTILSDSDKRRKYDESHGIISSEDVYESYHKGNHAVAAFARGNFEQSQDPDKFQFEEDPFRRTQQKDSTQSYSAPKPAAVENKPVAPAASAGTPAAPAPQPELSHIDRLRSLQNLGTNATSAKNYQFSRSHEADPEMEEKIKKCENVTGHFLKEVREYKRVSQDEIMDMLKISKNYLNALEEDDFARLPANVFVRGFVIQYAKALKVDHDRMTNSYMAFLRTKRPG